MPELRWILIIFGVILLVGIYVWGRRGNKQSVSSDDALVRVRPEPHLPPGEAQSHTFERHAASSPAPSTVESEDADELRDSGEYADDAAVEEPSITALRPVARAEDAPIPSSARPAPSRSADYLREASPVRRGRVEPTFNDPTFSDDDTMSTAELPAHELSGGARTASPASNRVDSPAANVDAPTLAMSDTPQPRRIERRKIIALRLAAASDRYAGHQLRETLEAESLQHGKYDVFHRLHEDGTSIFSVASMVEPGTFDLERMNSMRYPGVTLFAQLPGPVAGIQALHELVACGKRLQQSLGGTLQDERGVPLTAHRIERLRQEILDFENAPGRDPAQRHSVSAPSSPLSP